jgi:hypothetical protein
MTDDALTLVLRKALDQVKGGIPIMCAQCLGPINQVPFVARPQSFDEKGQGVFYIHPMCVVQYCFNGAKKV